MSLIYGIVADDKVVLAEYPTRNEDDPDLVNVMKIARFIVTNKIPEQTRPRNHSFGTHDYVFHYKLDQMGFCYMVVVRKTNDRDYLGISYKCIEDIKSEFRSQCNSVYLDAKEGDLNNIFSYTIQQKLALWNDSNADIITKLDIKTTEVKGKLAKAFDNFSKREDQLNNTEARLLDLQNDAHDFHLGAKQLKNRVWWQQKKCQIIVAAIVSIIVLLVILVFILMIVKYF